MIETWEEMYKKALKIVPELPDNNIHIFAQLKLHVNLIELMAMFVEYMLQEAKKDQFAIFFDLDMWWIKFVMSKVYKKKWVRTRWEDE